MQGFKGLHISKQYNNQIVSCLVACCRLGCLGRCLSQTELLSSNLCERLPMQHRSAVSEHDQCMHTEQLRLSWQRSCNLHLQSFLHSGMSNMHTYVHMHTHVHCLHIHTHIYTYIRMHLQDELGRLSYYDLVEFITNGTTEAPYQSNQQINFVMSYDQVGAHQYCLSTGEYYT